MPRHVVAEGKYLRFIKEEHWEYASRTGSSTVTLIIAVTPENELLLVEEYRIPVHGSVIGLPAGLVGDVDAGETTETAAFRELLEETGYRATSMELVNNGPLCPGAVDEIADIFYAHGLTREHEGGGDETEDITVHAVPLDEIEDWLTERNRAGIMVDPKVYIALYFIATKRVASSI